MTVSCGRRENDIYYQSILYTSRGWAKLGSPYISGLGDEEAEGWVAANRGEYDPTQRKPYGAITEPSTMTAKLCHRKDP